jgi:RNA polymerase sigma factor (sigma-70 family)
MLESVKQHLRADLDQHVTKAEHVVAWRQFYTKCDPLIRRFVRIYVRTASDMDDCTQEVWVRLIKRLKTFDYDPKVGNFTSWLYKVVRSVTAGYFRNEYRNGKTEKRSLMSSLSPSSVDDPAQLMDEMDAQDRVDAVLMTIRRNVSRPNYDLLYMRWVQQRSVEDVAEALDLSHRQVWYREHRARKKLRGVLSDRND